MFFVRNGNNLLDNEKQQETELATYIEMGMNKDCE